MKTRLPVALLALMLSLPSLASDEQLQKALELANKGQSQEAIRILESLRTANASDVRVLQSLGFLYKSAGRYDDAIRALEAATASGGSSEAYYALGLLYETKVVNAASASMRNENRQKALNAWKKFLSVSPADNRAGVAERHIKSLSEPE